MRNVKEVYQQLTEQTEFDKRYPAFKKDDGKIHILFISPCLNGTGYYRMIVPALELNRTRTHSAIISSIHKWNFNKQFGDYDNSVDEKLISWADYVVLPVMFSDVTYILKALKAKNNRLQFVMDLDNNINAIPKEHLDYTKITKEAKAHLLSNIAKMDILTGASEGILEYYDRLIERYHPNSEVEMEFIPNLVSRFGYQEAEPLSKNKTDIVRIGIIGTGATAYDTLSIIDVLKELKEKHEDKIELIFFGWNGKLPNREEPLKDIPFTYVKSVSFLDYFDQLNKLELDIALLPSKKIPFNTHGKSFIKALEFAVFAIPVVATDLAPYNEVIENKETGFLVKEQKQWIAVLDQLIEDKKLRDRIGKSALKEAWRSFSFTGQTMQIYQEVFS
ncbi:MAG: glycosyltransferase family 4 protein [Opitutaceae bacterium]|nr:glycosyltransferase family 4 protein [Opitutaceae bacterium]